MNNILVTPKSNIETDSDGKLIKYTDEDADKFAYKTVDPHTELNETEREEAWTEAYQSVFDTFKLIDPDDIGILAKTHVLSTMSYNPDTGTFESGITTRCEVYWDKRHSPAPAMHKPAELVWLELAPANTDDDEDPDDDTPDEVEEVDLEGDRELEVV